MNSTSAFTYLRAARPHQWLKNVIVFVPVLAAHRIDPVPLAKTTLAFVAFCAIASSGYLLNDLRDMAADRAHPRKRNRPLASGALRPAQAIGAAVFLMMLGAALAVPLGLGFVALLALYFAMTSAYSLLFKRIPVADICILAFLYTLRIAAGGAATAIPVSVWLFAFAMFLFFSLAAVKRQAELMDLASADLVEAQGRGYRVSDLPVMTMMAIASGYIAVLVLALYVNSPAVMVLYTRPEALWGACAVLLYWISRMIVVAHRGAMHDDPVVYALEDPVSLLCGGLVLLFVLGGALL